MTLKKITWEEHSIDEKTDLIRGYIKNDVSGGYDDTHIGDVRVYDDGTVYVTSEMMKGTRFYKPGGRRCSVEEGKMKLAKNFRDAMRLLVDGEIELHPDDTPESDDYAPRTWFTGNEDLEKEFTEKARKFKESMKSNDIEELKKAAKEWGEITKRERKTLRFPHDHVNYRTSCEMLDEWWLECYYPINDPEDVISNKYYHS